MCTVPTERSVYKNRVYIHKKGKNIRVYITAVGIRYSDALCLQRPGTRVIFTHILFVTTTVQSSFKRHVWIKYARIKVIG